jgi:hypothetical protein
VVADPGHYQFPLVAALPHVGGSKAEFGRLLVDLDSQGFDEVDALARLDLQQHGGRVGRPIAYLCSDNGIYWTKTKAQSGLGPEFIANRLANRLDVT